MTKQDKPQKKIRTAIFMGKEITDQIIFDAIPGQVITETMIYDELLCSFEGQNYLRIYQGNKTLTDYSYTYLPIRRPIDHKSIDRNQLQKPYFIIHKGGIDVYE